MNTWDLKTVHVEPRAPQILATNDARAIVVNLPAGESMNDHQVHERAWITVIEGGIEMTAIASGQTVRATEGQLFEFEPAERHRVSALTDARLLLLLAPWPGEGHPGAMALGGKSRSLSGSLD
jgi:quercetin dioxygenase-like cupin family protein